MIYLDYAATTPLDKEVLKAMQPYWLKNFGNPSSLHQFGQKAKEAIISSRMIWANFFGVARDNIIFTGSATESNNLAIRGFFKYLKSASGAPNLKDFHAITSAIEHKSVLETFKDLSENEALKVDFIKPNSQGIIEPIKVKQALKENTVLISIMYVNNEIGTLQPINEIAGVISDFRLKLCNSKKRNTKYKILNAKYPLFHSDCVQAIQFYDCDLKKLGVDFATASAHKIYGPKGLGVLACLYPEFLSPIITGGHQEDNLRSGTENVAAIVGAAQALQLIQKEKDEIFSKISRLKNKFLEGIIKIYPKGKLNGSADQAAPHILNFCFKGIDGHALLISLDLSGVAVSLGSACEAGSIKPSYVLCSIGLSDQDAKSSIRFSLGKNTTSNEIETTLKILNNIIKRTLNA